MNNFIDRKNELQFLNSEYNKPESSLVIVYGRRRTGKTTMISKFMEEKDGIYFLATEESEKMNKKHFTSLVLEYTNTSYDITFPEWEDIFKYILEKKKKPLILIDEFQYLGKENEAFPSIFQRIWDTYLKKSNTMVILCGSLITMMESQTLSYSSPLYGRRTGQIKLKHIPFSFYNAFMPEKTYEELVERYAVTGGVPKYIELFRDQKDIYEAIENTILDSNLFLYSEPEFLLKSEVKDVGTYFSIIRTIADGAHRIGEIAARLETSQSTLTYYLKTLIDLDILYREVPVTETHPEKSKKGIYQIHDNYLRFWFRFVYPYKDQLEIGNKAYVMNKITSNFIDSHVSYAYEDICRKQLLASPTFNLTKVGRYWDKDIEIDIVGIHEEEKLIVFGECKYWKGKVGLNVLQQLIEKSNSVNWNLENRKNHFILFSIHGFSDELIEYQKHHNNVYLLQ